jgi:signal transduction histidine kinase
MKLVKKWRTWNERTRLLLTLGLVVVPASALIIFSVMHLKSIQRDRQVEAALQRDFQQMLAVSEKRINNRMYDLVDPIVRDFPTSDLEAQFDHMMLQHPYIAHMFLYDPEDGMSFCSNPGRAKEADFRKEADSVKHDELQWVPLETKSMLKKFEMMKEHGGRPYYFFWNAAPRGEHYVYQNGVIFPAEVHGHMGLGGIVFDAEYLQNQFLPEMLEMLLPSTAASSQGASEHNHAVMLIKANSKDNATTAASPDWDGGNPEAERKMESTLPGLTLAIKYRGTTIAALGERWVHSSFMILGGLSLLLIVGIFLVYRSVAKEMALAKLKSDFVSNVSHELRTPLSLIRLYAETLEMGRITSADKPQTYYHIIRAESERLTALINNILDFSRIEAGRKEYEFRETDLPALVQSTLDSYRDQIEQHGFQFEEHIDPNIPTVIVDREAIARSLLNLVNNAIKYSAEQKYLRVNLYRENGSVKLEVEDHGIGIPSGEQHKVFEKFYRVCDPLVHNTKGSGLGLSLVRHIVQAHGGDVALESAPGKGSKFVVTLPIQASRNIAAMAAS